MARKALHGDLCHTCGERPRVQYKSGLSAYCRECTNARQRKPRSGGNGGSAPAAAPAPVTHPHTATQRTGEPLLQEQRVTDKRSSCFRPEWPNPQPVTPEAQRAAALLASAPLERVVASLSRAYTWR